MPRNPAADQTVQIVTDPDAADLRVQVVGDQVLTATPADVGKLVTVGEDGTLELTEPADDGGRLVVVKSAAESVTNSAVLQDDDELILPVAADEVWVARYVLFFSGPTAGDIQFAFSAPAGDSMEWGTQGFSTTTTGAEGDFKSQRSTLAGTLNLGASGFSATAMLHAYIANGATPGDVTLRWSQAFANATPTQIFAGSHLVADRVAA
jgi:hypothetical protein